MSPPGQRKRKIYTIHLLTFYFRPSYLSRYGASESIKIIKRSGERESVQPSYQGKRLHVFGKNAEDGEGENAKGMEWKGRRDQGGG